MTELEDAADDGRADRIEQMTIALLETFGDRALDVACRQIEQGGDAAETWRAIESNLSSVESIEGGGGPARG